MLALALSLRDQSSEPDPFRVTQVDDVTIAVLASAWGSWSGLDGEGLVVDAATVALNRAARGPEPLDSTALHRAFIAASQRLDRHPHADDEDGLYPVAGMAVVVATGQSILVGWAGDLTACVVEQDRIVRATQPHTLFNQIIAEQDVSEEKILSMVPAAHHITVRTVLPMRQAEPQPEFEQWPPLTRGQRLLLTDPQLVLRLEDALPLSARDPEPWLRQVLSLGDDNIDRGDRVGILLQNDPALRRP